MILRFYDKNKNCVISKIYANNYSRKYKNLFRYCRSIIKNLNIKVKFLTLTNF